MNDMSGIQKAAILLIALGPEKSATVFKHNIKILDDVKGQRVIVVQYATFK